MTSSHDAACASCAKDLSTYNHNPSHIMTYITTIPNLNTYYSVLWTSRVGTLRLRLTVPALNETSCGEEGRSALKS